MESRSSLPHSQVLATCPYPEPDQASRNLELLNVKKAAHIITTGHITHPENPS